MLFLRFSNLFVILQFFGDFLSILFVIFVFDLFVISRKVYEKEISDVPLSFINNTYGD